MNKRLWVTVLGIVTLLIGASMIASGDPAPQLRAGSAVWASLVGSREPTFALIARSIDARVVVTAGALGLVVMGMVCFRRSRRSLPWAGALRPRVAGPARRAEKLARGRVPIAVIARKTGLARDAVRSMTERR